MAPWSAGELVQGLERTNRRMSWECRPLSYEFYQLSFLVQGFILVKAIQFDSLKSI